MLEKMLRDDLCIGMRVVSRSGKEHVVDDGLLGNLLLTEDEKAICDIDDAYTADLCYGDGDEEHDLDIMRVTLPSGAVLWEREQVELRVFEVALYKANRGAFATGIDDHCEAIARGYAFNIGQWYDSIQGKLCTFKPAGAEQGLCAGYSVARSWTRELTDEEKKNWRKK